MTDEPKPTPLSRLLAWIEAQGISEARFAERLDITPQALNNWKKRGLPKGRMLDVARAMGRSVEWLEGIEADYPAPDASRRPGSAIREPGAPILDWNHPDDLPAGAYILVPRYDVHVSAGNGRLIYDQEEKELPQAFRAEWIRQKRLRPKDLICVYAQGNSMEDRIRDGDALLVDRSQRHVVDGGVYVLRYGDEVRVKRLFKRPDGGLIIRSDNTREHPEMVVTAAELEHIDVIGRVIHTAGEV